MTILEQINTFTDYTYILDVTQAMDVKYPGTEKLTEPLRAFIERDLGEVEKALYSFDYDSRDFGLPTASGCRFVRRLFHY